MDPILVVNAGSSSVKFQVFAIEGSSELTLQIKGQVDGIGTQPRLRARAPGGIEAVNESYERSEVPDVPAALETAGAWLRQRYDIMPIAVGHRVVHGGPRYDRPILVDAGVLKNLEQYVPLAPLHQPNNLAPIRSLLARSPGLAAGRVFRHRLSPRSQLRLPTTMRCRSSFYAEGVRRYGFHGLSYEYIAQRLPEVAPAVAGGRVIVAHLGSGASMCALANGRSVESSFGFTALDGLPMGTRPGQLDPGVVLFLIDQKQMSTADVQHLFYHESGLKGLSGISNDVRDLEASTDPRAAFALEYFVYRAGLYAGMLAAALGGLDAFVFTAGIGENSVVIACAH